MTLQKQYSISRDYWTFSIGFGVSAGAVFVVLADRYPILGFLSKLYRAFPQYPIEVVSYAVGLGLVLLTLGVLIYIPLRSFLFPSKIEGVLEECLLGSPGRRERTIAIRVASKIHK